MKKLALRIARRIGVPGLMTLLILTVMVLAVGRHAPWYRLAEMYAIWFGLCLMIGGSRTEEFPYLLCTHCGRKNRDDGKDKPDLSKWTCGWCKEAALVRVGTGRKAA